MTETSRVPPLGESHRSLRVRRRIVSIVEQSTGIEPVREQLSKILGDLTDAGNADWFASCYGKDLTYEYASGRWRIFDSIRWQLDEGGGVRALAERAIRDMLRAAANLDAASLPKLTAHATRSLNRNRLAAMVNLAQYKLSVKRGQFDNDPLLLGVANGLLDLRTGQLRAMRREDYVTRLAGTSYNEDAKAPLFTDFLKRIFNGEEEIIAFVQKAVGYSLTGLTDEQCWFLLHGQGANGKSTFQRIIHKLLGDYAHHAAAETFSQARGGTTNDLARMNGARLVTVTESDENHRLAAALMKQLTGGDPLTTRFLYHEYFTYVPQFKVWFATNHRPMISDTSAGQWRRIRAIPFNVTIRPHEQDRDLFQKLAEQLPGILNWALEGLQRYQKDGLVPPDRLVAAVEEYRAYEDALHEFFDECCVIGPEHSEAFADLYCAYRDYCSMNGENDALGKKLFGARLSERGIHPRRSSNARLRVGIRLRKNDS